MENKIHFNTIKGYFKEKYDMDIEYKEIPNYKTRDVYNVIIPKGTDLIIFAPRENGKHVCIDSDGGVVSKENIIGYAHIDDTSKDEHGVAFSDKGFVMFRDDKENIMKELTERENEIHRERTSIVLNASLSKDTFLCGEEPFYVDEIVYANDEDFEEIRRGDYSDILKEYNQKRYRDVENGVHGILIINKNGDGMLVNTEGADYAGYMCYSPKLEMKLENQLEREFNQKSLHEMKMYMPLKVVRKIEYGETTDIDGNIYLSKLQEQIRRERIFDKQREYRNNLYNKKVVSIKPDIQRVNDVVMGVVAIKMTEPLTKGEVEDIKDYITGELSQGWGKSFGEQAIEVDGNQVYVHFWDKNEYFIKTDKEMGIKQEQEQTQEVSNQGIQGMQGMSGM